MLGARCEIIEEVSCNGTFPRPECRRNSTSRGVGLATEFGARDRHLDFRLLFAYTDQAMAFGIQDRKLLIVACKRCRLDIPAEVDEFPFQSIVVTCVKGGVKVDHCGGVKVSQ